MSADQIVAFLSFALIAAITPGPSNVVITATGVAVGFFRGLPCVLGTAIGVSLLLSFAATGLGQLVAGWPLLLKILNWFGGAFLLWLAWKIGSAPARSSSTASKPVGFVGAALFQWTNPKGWLISVGAASTYLQDDGGHFSQPLLLGALFFVVAMITGTTWLGLGVALQRTLADERAGRIFNQAMGAILAASVLMMML